jgi:NADPH:quinone reductase-like Zn-dependent oxidoreductase
MTSTKLELRDRTALITGGAGGIGAAVASQLAAHGTNIALTDVSQASLDQTAAGIGGGRSRSPRTGLELPRPGKFKSTSRPAAPLRPATRGRGVSAAGPTVVGACSRSLAPPTAHSGSLVR